jgi:hypothetical protein
MNSGRGWRLTVVKARGVISLGDVPSWWAWGFVLDQGWELGLVLLFGLNYQKGPFGS